ncbi:hypothetical protein [Sphingomonas sp. Leaf10]|uniref:hypothetical protein n=1 Tax=Sphingomonas sp. Leaf10 TaxID=1735676 RepID=UPI0012E15AFC|nr:hypothetical protein [Sphingomonas sp. Leaf10]
MNERTGSVLDMGRRQDERRNIAEQRWPSLSNLLACYFNEDLSILYGSLEGAFEAAIKDGSLEHRRTILKEWRDWNASEGAVDDVRPSLYDGFAIAVRLEKPIDGRNFMNRLYDGLMERVRKETAPGSRRDGTSR